MRIPLFVVAISIATTSVSAQHSTEALALLSKTRLVAEAIVSEYPYPKDSALQSIANTQAMAGDFNAALQTIASIKEKEMLPLPLAIVGLAQAATGDTRSAGASISKIADGFYRAQALTALAQVQAKAGDSAAARDTFKYAIQIATALPTDQFELGTPHDSVLKDIAFAQMKAGFQAESYQTAKLLNEDDHSNVLMDLASLQAEYGNIEGAIGTVSDISVPEIKALLLAAIAKAEMGKGEIIKGKQHIEQAQKLSSEGEILSAIVDAFIASGDIKTAIETANAIKAKGIQGWAYKRIILKQLETGDESGAIRNATEHSEAALAEIVKVLSEKGKIEQSKELLTSIKETYPKTIALQAIAGAEARYGNIEKAIEIALSLNESNRFPALEAIAQVLVRRKDSDKARQLVNAVKWPESKAYILSAVAKAQAEIGDFVAAQQTASNIEDICIRPGALRGIASALVKSGHADDTIKWAKESSPEDASNILVAISEGIKETLHTNLINAGTGDFTFFKLNEEKGCH